MIELERTKTLLSDFGLTSAQDLLESQLERSIQKEDTYLGFLSSLLELEASQRRRRSIETRMKLAKFPYKKTLSDFDFSFQPGLDKRQIDELSELSFAARAENVIFLGPPGVGKTHLAVGLGMAAIDAGMSVYFTTLSELVRDLERAQEAGKLERHAGSGQRHALCAGFGQRAAECFDTGGHGSGFETSGISGYKG